jgi:hypothetical protein
MDDGITTIAAVIFLISNVAYGVWSNRNIPGFWTAEAIRARGRLARRTMVFGASIAGMTMCAIFFSSAPVWFAGWASAYVIVAWLCRPPWMCARRPINPLTPNSGDTPDAP